MTATYTNVFTLLDSNKEKTKVYKASVTINIPNIKKNHKYIGNFAINSANIKYVGTKANPLMYLFENNGSLVCIATFLGIFIEKIRKAIIIAITV
jgi:hypothetical protein